MALLLNIDTATEVASVCVSLNGKALAYKENEHQREHASFVHNAIEDILIQAGVQLKDMDAFAVTSGPGSYTGLRVGMATAKGFCYAMAKPLIAVNTLEVMAQAALETIAVDKNDWLCPMIDARRMEVFMALYDKELTCMLTPQPLIVEENSLNGFIEIQRIRCFGSGSTKFKNISNSNNIVFEQVTHTSKNLASLAEKAFKLNILSDVSYSEPQYFKDFHSLSKS